MPRSTSASILTAVVASCLLATAAPAAPPRWTFTDIGALFNVVEAFWPYGVNDLGQVTGSGKQGFFGGSPEGPFLTQPNSPVNRAPRAANPPLNPTLFVDQIANGTFNNNP